MQVHLEGWPALLTDEAACRFLSIEHAPFLRLISEKRISPVEIEASKLRWRRQDLERMIKLLPLAPVPELEAGPMIVDAVISKLADAISARIQHRSGLTTSVQPRALSVLDAARCLGVSRSKIYQLINEGRLLVRKIGGRTLILSESMDALLNDNAPRR